MNFFNIKKLFPLVRVTKPIYEQFIETGKVPKNIIRLIAFKTIKQEPLNEWEFAIFTGKTEEINNLIVEISKNDD